MSPPPRTAPHLLQRSLLCVGTACPLPQLAAACPCCGQQLIPPPSAADCMVPDGGPLRFLPRECSALAHAHTHTHTALRTTRLAALSAGSCLARTCSKYMHAHTCACSHTPTYKHMGLPRSLPAAAVQAPAQGSGQEAAAGALTAHKGGCAGACPSREVACPCPSPQAPCTLLPLPAEKQANMMVSIQEAVARARGSEKRPCVRSTAQHECAHTSTARTHELSFWCTGSTGAHLVHLHFCTFLYIFAQAPQAHI